jgi:hypothetical protein
MSGSDFAMRARAACASASSTPSNDTAWSKPAGATAKACSDKACSDKARSDAAPPSKRSRLQSVMYGAQSEKPQSEVYSTVSNAAGDCTVQSAR